MNHKNWIKSILISIMLFALIRPVLTQAVQSQLELNENEPLTDTVVGVDEVNGFSHVYYLTGQKKVFITSGNQNNKQPHAQGNYIAWAAEIGGGTGIFLYHTPSTSTIQLTNTGTSLNPKVSASGQVVWESWVDNSAGGAWQVFLFNGSSVLQLSEGELSVNPDIEDDYVVFARKDIAGTWRTVLYEINSKKFSDISVGIESKFPNLKEGRIVYEKSGAQAPLTAEDFTILDLEPLISPEATPSSQLKDVEEQIATESASLAPL